MFDSDAPRGLRESHGGVALRIRGTGIALCEIGRIKDSRLWEAPRGVSSSAVSGQLVTAAGFRILKHCAVCGVTAALPVSARAVRTSAYTGVVPTDFIHVFAALKPALASQASRLSVQKDSPDEYTLVTKSPSPFPQHKGQPMWFGAVKVGKAYVSYHLMPLYMNPTLMSTISPALKKRMQGKSCFNFNAAPDSAIVAELRQLTAAAVNHWAAQSWL